MIAELRLDKKRTKKKSGAEPGVFKKGRRIINIFSAVQENYRRITFKTLTKYYASPTTP